jgi:tetratricopeptide (TPR) repeat protein
MCERRGDSERALVHLRQALVILQDLGIRDAAAYTWHSLGYAHLQLGDRGQALTCYLEALALHREVGDRKQEAKMLARLGQVHRDNGDLPAARTALHEALASTTNSTIYTRPRSAPNSTGSTNRAKSGPGSNIECETVGRSWLGGTASSRSLS